MFKNLILTLYSLAKNYFAFLTDTLFIFVLTQKRTKKVKKIRTLQRT